MSASLTLRALSALSLAACVVAWALPEGPLRTDPGQVVEVETAYQTIRVVEADDDVPVPGDTPLAFGAATATVRTRFLRFDEDSTSYQSVHPLGPEGGPLTSSRLLSQVWRGVGRNIRRRQSRRERRRSHKTSCEFQLPVRASRRRAGRSIAKSKSRPSHCC